MKYLLLYKIEKLSKNIILKSYIDNGFEIACDNNDYTLIKKNNLNIVDEDIYIKILYSYLKRSGLANDVKGKVIDLTNAFKYAYSKKGYNKFDNKFDWFIRNEIIKEIIDNK